MDTFRFSWEEESGCRYESIHSQVDCFSCRFTSHRLMALSRCIGVFDTVRGYGVHEQVPFLSKHARELYGFPKSHLGGHVEKAFQALALNETRSAFVSIAYFMNSLGSHTRLRRIVTFLFKRKKESTRIKSWSK